jgi:phage terminase large subunit-like protein
LACPDWQRRIEAGECPFSPLDLDVADAGTAVQMFNKLRLPDVAGRPALRDAASDWFRAIVAALFGSIDRTTHERWIREILVLVAKKNSKTTYGAALMLTALLLNVRPRAEFLLVGPTKIIADLAFSQVVGMIEADDDGYLQKRFHPRDHVKEIVDRKTKAVLKIKTFDTGVLTGVKPAGVLIDELHEIASVHDADRVIGQIRGGLLPNPEGFLVFITTQSERPPAGVFRSELTKARMIRDGQLTGVPMLPVLYEFPMDMIRGGEGAAWRDPANWWMVNPNHGRSITIPRLVSDFEAAKSSGEEEIRRWASQHLNIEIGLALRSDRWAGADHWEHAEERGLTLESLIARSDVVTIGIDGGGLDDLFGFTVIGRETETRRWLLWTHAWAHQSVLERRKSEAARLLDFERDGDLTIVRGSDDDIEDIAETVAMIEDSRKLASVGLDPVGIGTVVDALAERGIVGDRVIGIPQGWKLAGAIKTMERKLADGTLIHAGQPLMSWAVGNAKVEPKGNAISITKAAAGTAKIDPLVAAFNAVALMATNPEAQGGPSIYETRGPLVL